MDARPTSRTPRRTASTGSLARTAATATLAAAIGASLLFLVARAADLDLVVSPPGQAEGEVPYVAVLAAVLGAGVLAFVGALVLGRLRRGSRWFVGLGSLALVASFASPLAAAEETSTALVLSAMHVVVAVAVVPSLARRMRQDER